MVTWLTDANGSPDVAAVQDAQSYVTSVLNSYYGTANAAHRYPSLW